MKPRLIGTGFGWIEIEGERITHDILICLDGEVRKRKKKLSKELYGTSHIISEAEADYIYQEGAEGLLVGGGQFGRVGLSPEADAFFKEKNCPVTIQPTPKALQTWNEGQGKLIGLFHITC
ncbi:MAG: Mth938-like domain-containing protein [Anaerolineales bacterium]